MRYKLINIIDINILRLRLHFMEDYFNISSIWKDNKLEIF